MGAIGPCRDYPVTSLSVVCCSVLQCVAVCGVLQCVVCRSVLSQVPLSLSLSLYMGSMLLQVLQGLACVVVCYSA